LLCHATTVVTNALLEGKGARAGLVATRGFRDVLELRRSSRGDLYDLFQDPPATLIPRRRRFEITERTGADGSIVKPLAETEIDGLVVDLKAARVESIAVSLLFSFLNPTHEQLPPPAVFLVFPHLHPAALIREFECTSTTFCAQVGPISALFGQARSRDKTDGSAGRST
jgi:N-methylhydantoinase A